MPKRQRIPKSRSKKIFRQGAKRTHRKNTQGDRPMRGGIRL